MTQDARKAAETDPVDVIIVGLGPVGATLANFLGAAGLRVVVYERATESTTEPRAAHFDGEAMRVFQNLGLAEQIQQISRPGTAGMHFVSATGQTLMVRTGSAEVGQHGYIGSWYFHQPELESVLERGLERFPLVDVHRGVAVSGIEVDQHKVSVTTNDRSRPRRDARFVVGCDGARSLARQVIATPSQDLGQHQPWVVVDVVMTRNVDLPEPSIQICDPARPMTLVNMAGDRRRWEIMLLPGDDPDGATRHEQIWQWLRPWIGPDDARLERVAVYTFHSLIAQRWSNGRLLIAGDAAHQTPPFLGQGMCAGLRDAANLGWKLPRAHHLDTVGRSWEGLLDTYAGERRPHVETFTKLAVRVGEVIQLTDPIAAQERDRSFATTGAELFSFPVPQLGAGLHLGGPTPVGTIAPQPMLADGTRLDDRIGQRHALIASPTFLDEMDPAASEAVATSEIALIDPGGEPTIQAWLESVGAVAALLRPDRYIAALFDSSAECGLDAVRTLVP